MMAKWVVSFRPSATAFSMIEKLVESGEKQTEVLERAVRLYYLLKHADVYEKLVFTPPESVISQIKEENSATERGI